MISGRGPNRFILIVVSAIAAVALLSGPADAKKKKKVKKPKAKQVFFLDTRLGWTYDSNVLNYSDADLDLYDSGADSTKFDIESKDDWIISPRIEAYYQNTLFGGHTSRIGAYFKYYYYVQNDIRRFQKYGLFVRQYFDRGIYFETDYYYIPEYYYRNQFYQAIGNWVEANFLKHFIKAEIGADITSSLKADVSYRFQSKSFNKEVSERDLKINGLRIDGIWRATRMFKFWAYYGFERAEAAGADDPDLLVKDVSYDAWDITIGARFYSRWLDKLRPQIVSTLEYRRILYQTNKYPDIYRFGRDDSNVRFRIGTTWSLPYKLGFDIDYIYQNKTTDLPVPSIISQLEYSTSTVSFELKRDF